MRKKSKYCYKPRCANEIFRLGLCSEHYEEDNRLKELREEAVRALHCGAIDSAPPTNPTVSREFIKMRYWWDAICRTINSGSTHPVLGDEVEFARAWAISLSIELVQLERITRLNQDTSNSLHTLNHTKLWVWERFENLNKGLRSNGFSR